MPNVAIRLHLTFSSGSLQINTRVVPLFTQPRASLAKTSLARHEVETPTMRHHRQFVPLIMLIWLWAGHANGSDHFAVKVVPAAIGRQLVRTAIPMPRGFLVDDQQIEASSEKGAVLTGTRILGFYPTAYASPPSARRAMLTWIHDFETTEPVSFILRSVSRKSTDDRPSLQTVQVTDKGLSIEHRLDETEAPHVIAANWLVDGQSWTESRVEIVESNPYFDWRRIHFKHDRFPCIIEIRSDALGLVALRLHVQSTEEARYRAPDIGWQLTLPGQPAQFVTPANSLTLGSEALSHSFVQGASSSLELPTNKLVIESPTAALLRRGDVNIRQNGDQLQWTYNRSHGSENVPMQWMTWRKADVVIRPESVAPLTPTLECPHQVHVPAQIWDEAYEIGPKVQPVGFPLLEEALQFHREAMTQSSAIGDDWGNVTSFAEGNPHGGIFGMNRLNHCRPLFEEGWRCGDQKLVEAGLLWCDNFHDLSIWWGELGYGGTRYNNMTAQGKTPPDDDNNFMWRSNFAVDFCTKGYDSFLLAYEQTGDPRMKDALDAQTKYASEFVQIKHQTRNVGDVRDFIYVYRRTGTLLDQGLRLFRELRGMLSTGDLFSQSGAPLDAEIPFIDDDETGYKHPFAKPYIIGYALSGLPELAVAAPDEPKLKDVIVAAATFLCDSQDPVGAWRYPHPKSTTLIGAQAIEHAWQISQADRYLGADEKRLDAIERVLRQRILGWKRTGKIFGGFQAWEYATGRAKSPAEIQAMYQSPDQRDGRRDYTEGNVGFGGAPPEGIVYFPELLRYYLQHRSGLRLLATPSANDPLGIVLSRVPEIQRPEPSSRYQHPGIQDHLPVFREQLFERLTFPLSWTSGKFGNFDEWRQVAREKVRASLLNFAPPKSFAPVIIAEEDRGTHWARKVVFNISADSRVLALQTVPKGPGPFPAVLLMHDHGAKFDIGKEKVIRPFDIPADKIASAEKWVSQYYGGRFLGDELAKRGYVCLATDMLNWSDRGGAGYENQQSLASNLMHLGMTHAGLIAHEDMQAAEFLATFSQVDSNRIAAMGLSVGCFRTWQLAALSDRIAAGVAICWMGTTKELMVPGNNQTKGQSAFVMTHPGLSAFLDYPDVASMACPKPMLFFNGLQDGLFPVDGVRHAYEKMQTVWDSQGVGKNLVTKLWDVPHLYDAAMQDEAFEWLDRQFQSTATAK